jgi:hypothetical protein
MVQLTRRVERECVKTTHRGRPLVVSLLPGDRIGIRVKGTRTWYYATVGRVFVWAAADRAGFWPEAGRRNRCHAEVG